MLNRMSIAVLVLAALMAVGVFARADDSPKNLKVFPKDTGRQELVSVMRTWSDALGVRCDYCHVQTIPGDHESFDWASDEKNHKIVARHMFQMVKDLNGGVLPKAVGEDDAHIACVTCHRGLTNPATIDQVMLKTVDKDGIDAAVTRYRELRDRYYGSGSYDFMPEALSPVIETLARKDGGLDGAMKFAEMNAELNPNDAGSQVMLGYLFLQKGDKLAAEAAARKALELNPGDRRAERLIQQLGQ